MGFWIRLDNPDDLETRHCQTMPERGEWIGLPESIRIIREHNERKAREEQIPDWTLDVQDELRRARAKFPKPDLLTTAFAEESGELVKAILDCYNGKESDIYTEAIQTIAMVVRILEEGDPVHRLAPIVDTVTIYKTAAVGPTESFPGFDPTGEGSAWQPEQPRDDEIELDPENQIEASDEMFSPDFGTRRSHNWRDTYKDGITVAEARSACGDQRIRFFRKRLQIPSSGPQLREAVQAIQERAEKEAIPEPWNEESSKGILALVNERDRLRDQVARLQEERDAAVGRAVLAERARAELLADLQGILQEVPPATNGKPTP